MKESNMILGYAEYNDNNYPFVYENRKLNLLPGTEIEWNKQKSNLINNIMEDCKSKKSSQWIENVCIKGITNKGKNIMFISDGTGSDNNGFIQYDVKVIYKYKKNALNNGLIKGLTIKADEIDYFFNPDRVFEKKIFFNKKDKINSFEVKTNQNPKNTKDCGTYNIKDLSIHMEISAYSRMSTKSEKPLSSGSKMSFEFDRLITLDEALEVISHQQLFLKYISYRKSINIKSINTFIRNKDDLREKEGQISILESHISESNKKKSEQILTFKLLEGNIAPLFQSLADGEVYLEHIPSCIDSKSIYDTSRIILLFTAFESEYETFFGSIPLRSERYFNVKKDVLDFLNEYKKNCSGKKKKDVRSLEYAMNANDKTLSSSISKIVKANMEIMEMFLSKEYDADDNTLINNMSQRLSSMRNHIAHGNLNLEIEPINLSDLHILEILIYIIRLSSLGISNVSIKRGICKLRGYKIVIPDETEGEGTTYK